MKTRVAIMLPVVALTSLMFLFGCDKKEPEKQVEQQEPQLATSEVQTERDIPPKSALEDGDRIQEARPAHGIVPTAAQIESILVASKEGQIEKVRKLLRANPNLVSAKNNDGWRPLHFAAVAVEKEIAELLISEGANVNVRDNDGFTPLHLAAATPFHVFGVGGSEIVDEVLIAKGAKINAKDKYGQTPLHLAARKDVAELLINKGARINDKNEDGWTPLHEAALKGAKALVQLLITKGAEINVRTTRETTRQHGSKTEVKIPFGTTPLKMAVIFNNENTADLLRQNGAKE